MRDHHKLQSPFRAATAKFCQRWHSKLTKVVLDVSHPEVTLFALHLCAQGTQRLAKQVHQQAQPATVSCGHLNLQTGQHANSTAQHTARRPG